MIQDCAIAAFTGWKRAQKLEDPTPEKCSQSDDRAELDDDAVHFPEAVREVDLRESFRDPQVCGRADGEKFGQAFEDAEQDGEQVIVHAELDLPCHLQAARAW